MIGGGGFGNSVISGCLTVRLTVIIELGYLKGLEYPDSVVGSDSAWTLENAET